MLGNTRYCLFLVISKKTIKKVEISFIKCYNIGRFFERRDIMSKVIVKNGNVDEYYGQNALYYPTRLFF